jgi:hypothetical protein
MLALGEIMKEDLKWFKYMLGPKFQGKPDR